MTNQGALVSAPAVLDLLRGFQKRTAEYAFQRLYQAPDSTRRFLIADEVGLGKTLVAAGLIGLAVEHLRAINTPRVDIIYICSNQAIARQNVNRIKQLLGIETEPLASRITLLPYRLRTLDNPVNLIALTPGTSFNSASAEGIVEERIILYRMLSYIWGDVVRDRRLVFQGGISSVGRFRQYEGWIPPRPIDDGIMQRFAEAVGSNNSALGNEFQELNAAPSRSRTRETLARRRSFIFQLRRLLAESCLNALEPDLVILDEFQRFRELLSPATESGELAQHLFEYEDSHTRVRTVLLSATPYKMYTASHEVDDDHYRDFLDTVDFLQGPGGVRGTFGGSPAPVSCVELPRVAGAGYTGTRCDQSALGSSGSHSAGTGPGHVPDGTAQRRRGRGPDAGDQGLVGGTGNRRRGSLFERAGHRRRHQLARNHGILEIHTVPAVFHGAVPARGPGSRGRCPCATGRNGAADRGWGRIAIAPKFPCRARCGRRRQRTDAGAPERPG